MYKSASQIADEVLWKLAAAQGLLAQEGQQRLAGIPESVLKEALQDQWLQQRSPEILSPSSMPIPISHEGKVVGFHLPARTSKGEPTTGDLYISKAYRRRGLGSAAMRRFLSANPTAQSFVHKNNLASRGMHRRAGFQDTGQKTTNNPDAMVWRAAGSTVK